MKSGELLIFTEEEEKWISALKFRGEMGKKVHANGCLPFRARLRACIGS